MDLPIALCKHCMCNRTHQLSDGFFSCMACGKLKDDMFSNESQSSDASTVTEDSLSNKRTLLSPKVQRKRILQSQMAEEISSNSRKSRKGSKKYKKRPYEKPDS